MENLLVTEAEAKVLDALRGMSGDRERLVFHYPKPLQAECPTDKRAIKVSETAYKNIFDVAQNSGLSMQKVASRMIEFAYDNIEWE